MLILKLAFIIAAFFLFRIPGLIFSLCFRILKPIMMLLVGLAIGMSLRSENAPEVSEFGSFANASLAGITEMIGDLSIGERSEAFANGLADDATDFVQHHSSKISKYAASVGADFSPDLRKTRAKTKNFSEAHTRIF